MSNNIVALEIGVTIPFVLLCFLSFGVRLYSRVCIAKSFGLDDWTMVAAFIAWIGQQGITYSWVLFGAGRHLSEVPAADAYNLHTALFVEEFWYLFVQLLIKMSFLLFYLRFLDQTRYRTVIFCTMVLVFLQVCGTWIFYALQCRPVDAYFHPTLYPSDACLNTGVAYYAPTAANVFVDVIIYSIPIFPLWDLQATLPKRLGLIAVMTLGGCTIIVSGLRFIVLVQLANGTDTTYIFGRVVIVTTIEFVTALVTANMPAIKAVWKYHVTKDLRYQKRSHGLSNYKAGAFSRRYDDQSMQSQAEHGMAGMSVRPDTAGIRPSSTTDSEEELMRCKPVSVMVTSQWAVTSDAKSALRSNVEHI